MEPRTRQFKDGASAALGDAGLQTALASLGPGLVAQRSQARARFAAFEDHRTQARDIRDRTLANLDHHLEAYEKAAVAAGAHVHWASTAAAAREIILGICLDAGARLVAKGKSMISEEISLNAHLEHAGITVVETDLGEYLLQIRGETPSHIIAPAIHLTPEDAAADFRRQHLDLPPDRDLSQPALLVSEARNMLRGTFADADVGITGANFLIAESGSSLIVTNEGNGDLVQSLARVHIVIASIDKVVPTFADASVLLRLLARSATGQDCTTYTTLSTGPRRAGDPDGPEAYHVILLDNGRSEILGSAFSDALRCIRCGACLNHCPVYAAIGGHAYGWVYPGPIGAVMTPALLGIETTGHLPSASTFCGRCEDVCPVKIPLPDLMRRHRADLHETGGDSLLARTGLRIWGVFACRPRLYHLASRLAVALFGALGRRRGRLRWLPFARGWTRRRDFPAPEGRTFQQLWAYQQAGIRYDERP